MSHLVVKVQREVLLPCMTCSLCHQLLCEATTIIECLHTFCRECIYRKLSDEEMDCCPICNKDLGCVPLEKLRPDHNKQFVRARLFPCKTLELKAPEAVTPIMLPAKRKERSLSSLVVSTPRVSSQCGMTRRRSKSIARKAARGSSFTIEKPFRDDSIENHPESSSSPESSNKYTQNMRQNSSVSAPSNLPTPETWEGKVDHWKPLDCLVEAAHRSKSSKGYVSKSEALHSHDDEGFLSKTGNKEHRQKWKVQDVKNGSDHTPPESDMPKKLRKIRQKKAQNFGDFRIPPQAVLDAASAKFDRKKYPIWFSLVASDENDGHGPPLPQISASYIRIKDGNIPVSFVQKYLKAKLDLTCEDEVEIKCMGQTVIPTLTLHNLVDLWLQTTTTERVSATIGSSAKDFMMVLGYARRINPLILVR